MFSLFLVNHNRVIPLRCQSLMHQQIYELLRYPFLFIDNFSKKLPA